MTDWQDDLLTQRREKDAFFGDHPRSPLPPDEQAAFEGLSYYDVAPDYRFEVSLDRFDDPEEVVVGTSTGTEQTYLAWGEFTVEIDGEEVTLVAYKADAEEDRLWVPFRDETSGEETYGAGRYLDLEPDEHRTADGDWILDFNQAYNPTCAYSDAYECPLAPQANWLEVSIEAGERAFEGAHAVSLGE
jgi:uncharacterized protein (DUF1684 family)